MSDFHKRHFTLGPHCELVRFHERNVHAGDAVSRSWKTAVFASANLLILKVVKRCPSAGTKSLSYSDVQTLVQQVAHLAMKDIGNAIGAEKHPRKVVKAVVKSMFKMFDSRKHLLKFAFSPENMPIFAKAVVICWEKHLTQL